MFVFASRAIEFLSLPEGVRMGYWRGRVVAFRRLWKNLRLRMILRIENKIEDTLTFSQIRNSAGGLSSSLLQSHRGMTLSLKHRKGD